MRIKENGCHRLMSQWLIQLLLAMVTVDDPEIVLEERNRDLSVNFSVRSLLTFGPF